MDFNKYREDYPFFKSNPDTVFFDNASTALKPKCVIDAVNHYYNDLCVNAHRGDYYLSYKDTIPTDEQIIQGVEKLGQFIKEFI